VKKESAVFVIVLVAVGSLVYLGSLPPKPKPLGWILWSPVGPNPCQGNYTVAAVIIGRAAPSGCASLWGIMIPPSEHGDLSTQGAYLSSNGASYSGVFLDDFDLQNASTQSLMLATVPKTFAGAVCPVMYAYDNQPDVTKGMACIALGITPRAAPIYSYILLGEVAPTAGTSDSRVANQTSVSTWLKIFQNATAYVNAKRVMIIAFGKPFAYWEHPVPPAYLQAIEEYARNSNATLVYFGVPGPG